MNKIWFPLYLGKKIKSRSITGEVKATQKEENTDTDGVLCTVPEQWKSEAHVNNGIIDKKRSPVA